MKNPVKTQTETHVILFQDLTLCEFENVNFKERNRLHFFLKKE